MQKFMKEGNNTVADYLTVKELYHYGILGQKWGVRRYQNDDGTLTEAGKKHYGTTKTVLESTSKMTDQASNLFSNKSKSKSIRKDYSNLSDEELKRRVNRLNLEEAYGRLSGDTKNVRSGKEWVHEILQDSAILVGMAGTAVGIYMAIKNGKK